MNAVALSVETGMKLHKEMFKIAKTYQKCTERAVTADATKTTDNMGRCINTGAWHVPASSDRRFLLTQKKRAPFTNS